MRLIDADALYNGEMKDEWFRFKERDNNGKESFAYSCAMQRLVEAPTVDAIPVVRCKDCVNFNTIGCGEGFGWCEGIMVNTGVTDTFFCAEGEKREEQNND